MENEKNSELEHELNKRDIHGLQRSLNRIEKKVDKTNGKVAENTKWRHYLVGAVTILWLIVVPLLIYVWHSK